MVARSACEPEDVTNVLSIDDDDNNNNNNINPLLNNDSEIISYTTAVKQLCKQRPLLGNGRKGMVFSTRTKR